MILLWGKLSLDKLLTSLKVFNHGQYCHFSKSLWIIKYKNSRKWCRDEWQKRNSLHKKYEISMKCICVWSVKIIDKNNFVNNSNCVRCFINISIFIILKILGKKTLFQSVLKLIFTSFNQFIHHPLFLIILDQSLFLNSRLS